ncbi:transcriptional regulator, AraC family [bacterium A37T11]|nr:transcriptional regulator, AraC family [bacterium A37T11]
MKPLFHKVPTQLQSSFSIRHDVQNNFGSIWHYHPELELHHVIHGEGVRFIGDNISNFSSGEIILIGSNLPHTWRCNEEYLLRESGGLAEAIVIHFLPQCLGRDFLDLPEAYRVSPMFDKAKKGLVLKGETRRKLSGLMRDAVGAFDMDRLIIFLSILKILAETDEYDSITSAYAFNQSSECDVRRLNRISTYTLTHYKKDITLEEISSISNLSVTSFCRYFKMMTNKTYYDFLIEIRISHACRMLVEDKLPTEMICFECGFNNVSNFYRHFKKVKFITPLNYKRKYLKNIQVLQ